MKTVPVCTVLRRPIMLFGVERRLLFGSGMAAIVVGCATGWPSLGLATCAAGYGFAWWTLDDPHLLRSILRATQRRTYYDPAAYRPPRIEVR